MHPSAAPLQHIQMNDLLGYFPDARARSADQWTATCPVCRRRKTLRINEGQQRAFVKCYSGCTLADILAALGLTPDALKLRSFSPAPTYSAHPPADTRVRKLADYHRAELQASGISDSVIAEMGCWTETNPQVLRELGFSPGQAKCTPCLVLPAYPLSGETLYQIKPDVPFRDEEGKPVKYMSPKGASSCLNVLPRIQAEVLDPTRPLFITEGTKKAASAIAHGLTCLSIQGVWMWQRKNQETGEHVALADWKSIPLEGRPVYVAFDSDAMRKEGVHTALAALLGYLNERGATVKIIYLPDGDEGEKVGLDDFLADSHSVEELLTLAEDTLRPILPELSQEVVRALQKRTKGIGVSITATGITFEEATEKAIKRVGYSLLAVEGQVNRVTFWGWGDLWLEMKKLVAYGQLWTTFDLQFGKPQSRKASDAARICKKFPADQRRDGRIPPWVFQEISTADEQTQILVLDTYEAEGLRRSEVRSIVRACKGLNPESPNPKSPAGGENESGNDNMTREMQDLFDMLPVARRRDFFWYIKRRGFGAIEELIDQEKREAEAEEVESIFPAGGGFEQEEEPESSSNPPPIYREKEGELLQSLDREIEDSEFDEEDSPEDPSSPPPTPPAEQTTLPDQPDFTALECLLKSGALQGRSVCLDGKTYDAVPPVRACLLELASGKTDPCTRREAIRQLTVFSEQLCPGAILATAALQGKVGVT